MKYLLEYKRYDGGPPSLSNEEISELKELLTNFTLSYDIDDKYEVKEGEIVSDYYNKSLICGTNLDTDVISCIGFKSEDSSIYKISNDKISHLNDMLKSLGNDYIIIDKKLGNLILAITTKEIKNYYESILSFDDILKELTKMSNPILAKWNKVVEIKEGDYGRNCSKH